MTRSATIDATSWRNLIEFERLTVIYLGFFSDGNVSMDVIHGHIAQHRKDQQEATRLAELKKAHEEWVDKYMGMIRDKQK
tara:strand:- start:1801 stop:2040 length:240 start_codon:yes stop_codon:yes gene_type:complete